MGGGGCGSSILGNYHSLSVTPEASCLSDTRLQIHKDVGKSRKNCSEMLNLFQIKMTPDISAPKMTFSDVPSIKKYAGLISDLGALPYLHLGDHRAKYLS